MSKRDYTISTSGGTTPSMTGQGTTLSAKLTDNGLEVWNNAQDGIATYMLTPTISNGFLDHDNAYGQNTFKGDAHQLLEALGNISTDANTQSALQESIAYGTRILEQRFFEQVIATYHTSNRPISRWTPQHDEILKIIHATILDKALASKRTTTTINHSALRDLVEIALCFKTPLSLGGSDWIDLATRCLGEIYESK